MKSCADCRFFIPPVIHYDRGICKRNPPTVLPIVGSVANSRYPYEGGRYETGSSVASLFPEVAANNWCGEWKERVS